jgi:hypothetical protein
MTTHTEATAPPAELLQSALNLVERATELADNYDDDVRSLVVRAAQHGLPEDTKRRFFTRVVTLLHNGGVEPDEETKSRLAAEVRAEVAELLASSPLPAGESTDPSSNTDLLTAVAAQGTAPEGDETEGVKLVPRNGLEPHDVVPIPTFKGVAVPMREGYIDISRINLWKGNHRVALYVEEFREREGREPDDLELLAILHGDLVVGADKDDPFEILPLARSIAAKGVERPPILTWNGEPKDGNRRIAAAKYVLKTKGFSEGEKERARWVRVWVTPDTTDDVIDAIVVALNFESDFKKPWEEYVKARLVVGRYRSNLDAQIASGARITQTLDKRLKTDVGGHYGIPTSAVTRYIQMVRWADDFEAFHVEERGREEAKVRYKANDIFQWFFEIQAGRGADKLTNRLDADEELKEIVYDLMFDVLDSGAQVRSLHKVIADEPSLKLLTQAHDQAAVDRDESKALVLAAIAEAAKNSPTRKVGFEAFLKNAVDRLGSAPPKQWQTIETQLLRDLRRVLPGAIGAIEGELGDRGVVLQES